MNLRDRARAGIRPCACARHSRPWRCARPLPPTKLMATTRGSAEASSKPNRVCAKTSSFGVLRNTSIDVAELDLAARRFILLAAAAAFAALGLGLVPERRAPPECPRPSPWRAALRASAARSSRQAISLVMVFSRFQVGVAISSRYCVVLRAARPATSSSHSPVWLGSVPPNFVNAPKKWSCPVIAFRRHEAAHGEGVDQPIVKPLVLQNRGGGDCALDARRRAVARDLAACRRRAPQRRRRACPRRRLGSASRRTRRCANEGAARRLSACASRIR